jgi:hypothetical protein
MRSPCRLLPALSVGAVALVVCQLVAASLHAQDGQPPIDPDAPASEKTIVLGEPAVDLRGLWLLVANGELKSEGKFRNTVLLYRGDGEDHALTWRLAGRELPPAIQAEVDKANRKLQVWTPTSTQLEELGRTVDRLPTTDPKLYAQHEVKLVAADHFDDADVFIEPELREGSTALLRIQHTYRPQPVGSGAQVMSDQANYAIQRINGTVIEGQHIRVVLAAGFAPIPVASKGPYRLYRLRGPGEMPAESPTPTSRLAALWDALTRGCK